MRNGFLAVATIVAACAVSAWSQEPKSSKIDAPPVPGESEELPAVQPTAPEVQYESPADQPYSPSEDVGGPWLTGGPSNYGSGNRVWARAEFLLWSIKQGNIPPLASAGALGSGTTTLYGGDQDYDARLGGRFTLGAWLDSNQKTGIEGSYFFLSGQDADFNASSTGSAGSTILARPFVNANNGLPDQQLVAFPDIAGGTLGISSSSQLQGAELNLLCNVCCCKSSCCQDCCSIPYGHRVDLIGGFRYFQLNENLGITENITFLPGSPAPGDMITVVDRFETRNDFYGGQVGARGEWWRGRWFVNATGKVALGNMHQEVRVNGATTFTSPGVAPVTQPGGLLALPTNIGNRSRDVFAAVPEIGLNVGRQVTSNVRIFTGYSLLYFSNVVRPGDQIDTVINPTQLPTANGPGNLVGDARPAPLFRDTDFWAQGVNFGVEVSW